MGNAVRIFLRQFRHGFELCRIEAASRNFYTLHPGGVPHSVGTFGEVARRKIQLLDFLSIVALAVVVALAIGSTAQAGLSKKTFVELALFAQGDLCLEDVDLAGEILGHLSVEFFFPKRVGSLHYWVLSCGVPKFQGFKSFKVSSSKTGMSNLIR